ncbi:TetR/AcrR family transcriptional regulator [Salinibacterium sp. ZJ70]|uniref:TetR/AcrR family transcriptional regulator n=1 Tax=Salinibacterium sp. ZJ70 TaxID=2708084 RepID=UPI00141DC0C1|nr:TetR/AcrR family transcriptional regulator [Salinibacterium sp. ZJ70]
MPLPRFQRLALEERRRILAVAARHIADRGLDGISLGQLADEAEISRSALYTYFDGRDDVIRAATDAAGNAVADAVGAWERHADADRFWSALDAALSRMRDLLARRPELRSSTSDGLGDWLDDVLADAEALGLVATANRALARAATAAIIEAADGLDAAQPGAVPVGDIRRMLGRVWSG